MEAPCSRPAGVAASARLGFALAQRAGMLALVVQDTAILAAQASLWERQRIVAEPGGAAELAAPGSA